MKALCLSGGGARGSFQMGAIKCLYTRYGYRPDLIVGTSVGAVNGVKLAEGRTPAEQLAAMEQLESQWLATVDPSQFFVPRPEFSAITGALLAEGPPGGRFGLPEDWQLAAGSLLGPISGLIGTVLLAVELDKLKHLLENLQTLNSLLLLDPIRVRLGTASNLDLGKVASGTPLYLATVSLETGALRYVTGKGEFVEKDGVTPVASALQTADLNAGLLAADSSRRQAAERTLAEYDTRQAQVAALKAESRDGRTTIARRVAIAEALRDLVPRAGSSLRRLREQIRGIPEIIATVDVIDGVIASAAIPGIFDSVRLGRENYVDGGVREVLPIDLAVRKGADEIVAVSCSSNRFPDVDSYANAGVLPVLSHALIDTSLTEVFEGDLVVRGTENVAVTKIMPSFDVHDSVQVSPTLIEISMHYGFMRAADVMRAGLTAVERAEAFDLSDALTQLRRDSWEEERALRWGFAAAPENHRRLPEIRVRKWAIKALLAARRSRGLPVPDFADLWAFEWERDLRTSARNPLGMPNPWAQYATRAQTTLAESLGTYAPDGLTVSDRASAQLFELVRGAAFPTATTANRDFSLPAQTARHLPKIPPGRNLLVESGDTQQWFCDGRRRYSIASPAVLAAVGMSGAAAATVPRDGLDQIPDGGAPFWAGNLVVVDSAGTVQFEVEVTQREGSDSTFKLMLLNRGTAPVTVATMDLEGYPAAAGLSLQSGVGTVAPGMRRDATLRFAPTAAGTFSGVVSIRCDDTLVPRFRFPLTVIAAPLGEYAELSYSPSPLAFVGRVGQTDVLQLQMANGGATDASVERVVVEGESVPGAFAVPWTLPPAVPAGGTGTLSVSCTPQRRGRATGTLAVDTRSQSTLGFTVRETARIQLTSTATAPVIALRSTRPATAQPGGGIVFLDPDAGGRFGGMRGGGLIGGFDPVPNPQLVPLQGDIELDLGAVSQGTPVDGTFFIGNFGDADLAVTGIVLREGGFYGDQMTFPLTVAPGDWVEVGLHTGTGGLTRPGDVLRGIWSVLSDDPLRPDVRVIMTVRVSGPNLTVPTDFVDFGQLAAATTATRTLQLRNGGDVAVSVDKADWSVGKMFRMSGVTFPAQVTANGTLDLTLEVPSTSLTGNFVDYLRIEAPANFPASIVVGAHVRIS